MNLKPTFLVLYAFLLSCQQGPPYAPKNLSEDEKPVEDTMNVVSLEQDLAGKIKDLGTRAMRLQDGRLKVQSRLLNTSGSDLHIQIQVVFKDDSGFSTGDETPWKHELLARGNSLNYETTSLNEKATRYVIKVREVKE
jgi:hypothetical protein